MLVKPSGHTWGSQPSRPYSSPTHGEQYGLGYGIHPTSHSLLLALMLSCKCDLFKYQMILLFCRPYVTDSSVKFPTVVIIVLSEDQARG